MKSKRAWIVKWESSSITKLSHIEGPLILAFLDGRKSHSTVREIIIGIYLASNCLTPTEKANYGLTNEGKRIISDHPNSRKLICGLNPWVVAYQVCNLEVIKKSSEEHEVSWDDGETRHSQLVKI